MTHKQALKKIISRFDSPSRCSDCKKVCEFCGDPDMCEDNGLICKKKLLEAAEELDNA